MKHPYPWLARLALLAMVGATAAGLAGVTLLLLPVGPTWMWCGGRVTAWQWVESAEKALTLARDQLGDLMAAVAGPGATLLAAWALRLVATGRLAVTRAAAVPRLIRWPAVAVMGLAVLAAGSALTRWVDPGYNVYGYRLAERVEQEVEDGWAYSLQQHGIPGFSGWSAGRSTSNVPEHRAVRLALALCNETFSLFTTVRGPALLFLLCGVVYCVARPPSDPEA